MTPKLEDFEVLTVIGSGSFGTCYKVAHKTSGEQFVWKAVDYGKLTKEQKENLVSEVNILKKLDHPNIVKYYDRILHKETTTLYIITELCRGGDLNQLIKRAKSSQQPFREAFIWTILYQLARAVQFCHTRLPDFTVLHRDIKPANVYLDESNNVKLGDFGLARPHEGGSSSMAGTPHYMSPEIIKGRQYSRKSDIWAMGCLIYEMCALVPPFASTNFTDLTSKILSGKYERIPHFYSNNLAKLISFMITVRLEFRPTVEMILYHPLVVQNIKSDAPSIASTPRPKSLDASSCLSALKNISITTDADVVSDRLFKNKWLQKLETLRAREAQLKEKEQGVALKERNLVNKEKHLALIERQTRERLARVDVYLKRRKNPRPPAHNDDDLASEISADPGDTSILPTTAKIDPATLSLPKFVRSKSERRRTKSVAFDFDACKENVRPPSGGGSSSHSSGIGKKKIRKEPGSLQRTEQPVKLIHFI